MGAARDGLEAVEMIKSLRPDIVILDYAMPNLDGMHATKEIKEASKSTKIVIYSMFSDVELIVSLLKEGISGYVLKGRPISELVMAVNAVAEGGVFYSEAVGRALQEYLVDEKSDDKDDDVLDHLSPREREIFVLLADGLTPEEIADRLHISSKTVETHKYNIMDKLNLKSIAEWTKIAVRQKLIDIKNL
ncbi:MAG: response regulator transcription factor [Deltaproteobacteria bacterium]|nr:response regulator transcription factor [Deltaproteobacteria bacterium]